MVAIIPIPINAIPMVRAISRADINRPRAVIVSSVVSWTHKNHVRTHMHINHGPRRRSAGSKECEEAAQRYRGERCFPKQLLTFCKNRIHVLPPAFRAGLLASCRTLIKHPSHRKVADAQKTFVLAVF